MDDIKVFINRFFSHNKFVILIIIAAITFILLFFFTANKIFNKNKDQQGSSNNATSIVASNQNKVTVNNAIENVVANNTSNNVNQVGQSITSKEDVVKAFIDLCNKKRPDLAYNMLTDECKKVLYPTQKKFEEDYYNNIFSSYKKSNVYEYKKNIYKVSFEEDSIKTGVANQNQIVDYITVDKDKKVNISKFIKSETLKGNGYDGMQEISITKREIYLDYEVYTIRFKNRTRAKMYLDPLESDTLFVSDKDNNYYYLAKDEYIINDMFIDAYQEKEIKIKINRPYLENSTVKRMYFTSMKIENQKYKEKSFTSNEIVEKITTYPDHKNIYVNI